MHKNLKRLKRWMNKQDKELYNRFKSNFYKCNPIYKSLEEYAKNLSIHYEYLIIYAFKWKKCMNDNWDNIDDNWREYCKKYED